MKQTLLFCSLLFILSATGYAQTAELTGTVKDIETGEALNGATIKIDKGRGNLTDASGKFHIIVPAGTIHLSISFIGYKAHKDTFEIAAGGTKDVNIGLKPTAIQISEGVTVSQYRKNTAKESVTTEVIGKDQIKHTNSNNLGDVVNKTPGVLVQDGQISIRGGSSYSYGVGTRTAVLSDGLSLMSADLGEGQSRMAQISNVKQVEVIKGASSVVYGSSALNGVVNLITEWPTDAEAKTTIDVNFGVYDRPKKRYQQWWQTPPFFTNINVNYQQRIKDLQVVAGGNITADKSYLQFNDQYRMQVLFKTRYLHPKIEGLNFGVNGSMQYERSERFFISKDLDTNIFVRNTGSDDRYIRTTIEPFVSYQNSKGHRITSNWRYMNIFRKGNGKDDNAISHQLISDNQYQYKWKNMLIFTAGVPFTIGYSQSNLYSGLNRTFNVAAYSQLEFNYKFLSLQGGVRYEVAGVDTNIVTGIPIFRAGFNIQAGKATFFRGSWGQGYRIPTIGEKYIAQQFITGIYIVPNDTLRPERGWSMELGFKQGFKIGKNWSAYFDAAFYWQQYKNFIEYQFNIWDNHYSSGAQIFPDSAELPPYSHSGKVLGLKPLNVEDARIAGYELGLAGKGKIGPVGVQLGIGYTYSWPGKFESTQGEKFNVGDFLHDMFKYNFQRVPVSDTAKILYYRIRHLVRGDVEVSYWKCYVGATISYGSAPEKIPNLFKAAEVAIFHKDDALETYTQDHIHGDVIIDLRAGIKVSDHVDLGFIVKNLTNRLYELRPGMAEPIRNFTLQFHYLF